MNGSTPCQQQNGELRTPDQSYEADSLGWKKADEIPER